jgi:hypothetical protein
MEILLQFSLPIDFALFVLILLVQLIIYPSFQVIHEEQFTSWHNSYCQLIGFIVLPLMVLQLLDSAILAFKFFDPLTVVKLLTVLISWFLTLLVFLPLHNQLRLGWNFHLIHQVVRLNWLRTLSWGMALLLSMVIEFTDLV